MRITNQDTLNVLDKITRSQRIKNIEVKMAVEGENFIATLSKHGQVHIFDKSLNLISSKVIPEARSILANSRLVVQLKNGSYLFYDKSLKLQFSRQVA